jgi:hypothetical protein
MMLNLMNPLSINQNTNNSSHNHTNLTDCEFYSNVSNPPVFTNNSHTLSEAGFYGNATSTNNNNLIDSFPNPHSFNQNHNFYNQNHDNDDFSNEAAVAAANAAFNSPFLNNNTSNQALLNSNNSTNEPSFLRHTIRPKPIAIPLNASSIINSNENEYQSSSGMFSVNSSQRKSFKNLPIATATLISSNNNNNNNNSNFSNSQSNANSFFNDLNLKQVI